MAATIVAIVSLKENPHILFSWKPLPGTPRADANGHGISIVYV